MKIVHNAESKQINVLDERFYQSHKDDALFYPSVTTVLNVYPKGIGFTQWLKQVGFNADHIVKEAGEIGSKIHHAIENHLKGIEIHWINEDGSHNFTLREWQMLMSFKDFMTIHTPELLGVEVEIVSDTLRIGGTIDMPCVINGETWLIDHKTSNAIHRTHELQLCAYAHMWNEVHPDQPIDRVGVMWLKAKTRGIDKTGKKLQGKGWQVVEFTRKDADGKLLKGKQAIDAGFALYNHTRAIWDEENPKYTPKNLEYPDTF
jgi:hypothetical protein